MLGVAIVVFRVVFRILFAGTYPGTVVLDLPEIPLPDFVLGFTLLGPVTRESLLAGLYDGMRLATIVICVGAANSLANPKRLLRSVPPALYEIGTALVVAVTVLPQFAESVRRVRAAQSLRAGESGRVRRLRRFLVPVLEDSLERSLALAAGMDTRGYGRSGGASRADRRLTGALMLAGLVGVCVGVYAVLDETAPRFLALPMLVVGVAVAAAGLVSAGRRVQRTRYRPDPWLWPEFAVIACGIVVALVGWWVSRNQLPIAYPDLSVAPEISLVALLGALVGVARRRGRPPTQGGRRMIELRGVTFRYDEQPVLADVDLTIEEGELVLVSGPTGVGKSTLLGMVTGPGAAVHRRDPHRRRAARRGQHRRDPAAGARARDRVRRAGPGRRVRHRHRRGGARLRHGAARPAAGHDAPPGRGDAGPARHRRAARPRPAHPLGRRAAAGGDRRGAADAPAAAGARRADVRAGPDGGRGGAGHADPPGERPRDLGAARRAPARAGGAVRRPDVPADRSRPGARRHPGRAARRVTRRAADRGARPGGGVAAAPADRARRPAAGPGPTGGRAGDT